MILYHGTSTKHLDAVLRSGLQSRRTTKRRSNWKGRIRSKPDFVYLTDAYPVYFAMNTALKPSGKSSDIVILKVEVEESRLYPDEDFIAWEMAPQNDEGAIRKLIARVDPADHQDRWRASLELNGIVCTTGVSADRLVAYKIIACHNYDLLLSIGGDAMPTPLNYRFMGSHFRLCIEALFEHGEEAALEVAACYWPLGGAS